MSPSLSRRSFLLASAAAGVAPHVSLRTGSRRAPAAVASLNGMASVKIAVEKMLAGVAPVEAAVLGIEPVENDPEDDSVGYGGLPNEEGVVELDACVMDGPTGLAGAVAALRNIKNPAQVALKVLRTTDHVLLVGEGALRFARAHGFVEQNLLTEASRRKWLEWKQRTSKEDDWLSPEENALEPKDRRQKLPRPTGTIHVGCVNQAGDVGSATSTSGLAFKIPGRVGDSPLIGCGNYCDNDVGTAGSTGRGEAVILSNGAAFVVAQMAAGKSPVDACLEACKRIARLTRIPRLRNEHGRPDFQVNFYAANKAGQTGAASIYPGRHARMTENGPEKAENAYLHDAR
jgi:N4-(beta-N-acetylglucosaminyl)-L-asparaginase